MDRCALTLKRRNRLIFMTVMFMFLGLIPESSISAVEDIGQISSAKSIDDVFHIVSATELKTTEECPIAHISDLAVDSRGNFFVADGWQSRGVYVYGPEGTFIKELGRKGQGPGEYANPVSVEIAQDGEIWVADYGNNRISIYSGDLGFKRQIICKPRILYYLHLSSRNEIFMYRSQENPLKPNTSDTIFCYDEQGSRIDSFAPFPKEALKVKFWAGQDGMTIGGDDFIYEMNPLFYRIRKFSSKGELITSFARKTRLFEVITEEGKSPIIVYGPFYLEKGLILAHVNEHLEIYDTNGHFIVGELPFTQRIVDVRGNRLYTELWGDEEDPQNLLNPKIVCYQIVTR
jgi:hypothetical protein